MNSMSDCQYLTNPSSVSQERLSRLPTQQQNLVPLHRKCTLCRDFLETFHIPDLRSDSYDSRQPEKWSPFLMCTVGHVLESHRDCHLCNLIFAAMNQKPWKHYLERHIGSNVYLQPRTRSGSLVVSVILAADMNILAKSSASVGSFELGHYTCKRIFQQRTPESLDVNVGSDAEGPFHQHITAKQIPRCARENVTRARSWISTCSTHHEKCQAFQKNTMEKGQRPSRVLEVTATSARLRCNMSDQPYDYLVLSHMWGNQHGQKIQLLESNLAEFQIDIPWDELCASPTYKEAVRITCALGYRYLWIDSLCIMQNHDLDWQHEASRMAIVYGNAICNISLVFSTEQDIENAERDDPRNWNPCILRQASPSHPGLYIERVKRSNDLPPWLQQHEWPLFDRAWTFQEYLLSPRTLLVGHTNLMFQCSELFYDELLGPIGDGNGLIVDEEKSTRIHDLDFQKSHYFPATLTMVKNCTSLTEVPVLLFMEDWLKIFNEYRGRKLTVATDRIIAFAGVARVFSHLSQMTYLGGAWQECLALCLLWHLDKKPHNIAMTDNKLPHSGTITFDVFKQEDVQVALIPSWSWFSAPIYAYHNLHLLLCSDELSLRRKSNSITPAVCFDEIQSSWAKLSHFPSATHILNTDSKPSTHYSNFKDLHLILTMHALPVSTNLATHLSSQLSHIQRSTAHPEDSDFDCHPVFKYHPDDIAGKRRNPPQNALLALVAEYQIVRLGGTYGVQRVLAGLVLVPAETDGEVEDEDENEGEDRMEKNKGSWRRIGIWKLKVKIVGIHVNDSNLAHVAQRWKQYEIINSFWSRGDITVV